VKVLVTGGAGFIGSRIVAALLDGGADVRVVDLRAPSSTDDGTEVIVGDIADPAIARRAVAGVDAVCHQAAKVGLGVDFADAPDYVRANDTGTVMLLEALWQRSFTGRFVLASSMVVYGEGHSRCPDHGVVRPGPRLPEDLDAGRFEPRCPAPRCRHHVSWLAVDEDTPVDPRNVYAATKLHQEHLCSVWAREAGAQATALRYHNVYGPGMPRNTPYAGVASLFLSALAQGRSPSVFEDGGQTRDFVHVQDVARANVLALTRPGVRSGACNVASGRPRTVHDMAAVLAAAFGPDAPAPVVTGAWRLGDVRHIVASPDRAADELGFAAAVSFEDGLAGMAAELAGGGGAGGGAGAGAGGAVASAGA
jgi:dTDP-L-rhamnose 4-epimerase